MTDPDTNLEMIAQCMQRAKALELTVRSIINNTNDTSRRYDNLVRDSLFLSSTYMNETLKLLNKMNTKA